MRFSLFFFLALPLAAQSGLTAPSLGWIVDRAGDLRPLTGISGNVLLGDPAASQVLAAASSDKYVVWKTADTLSWRGPDGQVISVPAPDGGAHFAFRNEQPAAAYFAGNQRLYLWNRDLTDVIELASDLGGAPVLALEVRGARRIDLLCLRQDTVWRIELDLTSEEILRERPLAGVAPPAAFLPNGDVISSQDLPLPNESKVLAIEPLLDGWFLVRGETVLLALAPPDRPQRISIVPEPASPVAAAEANPQ
jgi:hypothetical protein